MVPSLTIILVLLVASCLGLGYAILWLWIDSGRTLENLEERVTLANVSVQGTVVATTDSGGAQRADEVRQDFVLVQKRQISWGDVFHTLLDVPDGLVVDSVIQSGFTLTVDGRAADLSITNEYLTGLQASGLFQQPQVQLEQISRGPIDSGSAVGPTPSSRVDTTPSKPSITPQIPSPVPPRRILPTSSPTSNPTNTITVIPSITQTAAPAPEFDFALVVRKSTGIEEHRTSHIRATLLDEDGNRIPGVTFRIESEGSPAWSAEKSNQSQQDGVVEFVVTKGVYTVLPLVEGRVQAARGLVTGYNDVPGKQEWMLVWRKVESRGSPVVSPTYTSTIAVTPSPTTPPRWAGRNIARLGSATSSRGQDSAHRAIDGNAETIWQSGGFPIQEIVITLNDLYRKSEIDGLELLVAQSSIGRTTHQIWVEDENGDIHPHTTELTSITRDRQILVIRWDPRSVGDAEAISRVFIRTISGPSWVGWREIGIYEKVPPPLSTMTPTRTSTATSTATICPVETCTATPSRLPTATSTQTVTTTPSIASTYTATRVYTTTPTGTPTWTYTATPTITPTSSAIAVGLNVAPKGTASSSVGFDSLPNAIDGDVETTWNSGASGVQEIVIDLDDRYQVDAVALVVSQLSPGLTSHEVWVQETGGPLVLVDTLTGQTEDRQTLPVHLNPAIAIDRLVIRTIRSSGNVAWREIRIFERLPPPLSTFTPTRTHTPAPTATPTFISAGRNVAAFGTASATSGSDAASFAIDNDPETAWEANIPPSQSIQIDFDDFYSVEAISLVLAQPTTGTTTHQVFIQDSSESLRLIRTLESETSDRETLAVALDPVVEINKIVVKTNDAPGSIGWREIRVFEQVSTTPLPTDNSPQAKEEQMMSQSRELPDVSEVLLGFLRFVVGSPAGAMAAPAGPTPTDGSLQMGVRFKLVLEVEPGSGYHSE